MNIPRLPRLLVTFGKLFLFGVAFFIILSLVVLPLHFSGVFVENTVADSPISVLSIYIQIIVLFITIFIFYRFIDHKKLSYLGLPVKGHLKEFFAGSMIAILLMVSGFVILLSSNQIDIETVSISAGSFLNSFMLFLGVSIFEEVLCRGYILGTLMDSMNKFIALLISSLIFAVLHIPNNHISFIPVLNLFLAGVLLGSAYIYTRNLWFPIGMHLFWNFVQGTVLGFNVSGTESYTILKLRYPENNLYNGGDFGFEGSIFATLLTIISILLVIRYYEAKKRYMQNERLLV